MTEIKARVPIVDKPNSETELGDGGKMPKYGWRDGVSFDGDYTGDGDPIVWFRVGEGADGDKFAADLASDPDVQILGRRNR
jgi:hypothetical protein